MSYPERAEWYPAFAEVPEPLSIKTLDQVRRTEWFRAPNLVVVREEAFRPRLGEDEVSPKVREAANIMLTVIEDDFSSVGSRVYRSGDELPDTAKSHAISTGIYYYGALPPETSVALQSPFLDNDQAKKINHSALPEAPDLRENLLMTMWRKTGLDPSTNGNFRPLIFIQDDDQAIAGLAERSYEGDFQNDRRLQAFIRQVMGKVGTLSAVFCTWRKVEGDHYMFDKPILSTLEGSHPTVTSVEDLSVRLMEIGSSKEVPIEKKPHPDPEERITLNDRLASRNVAELQNFMWFLGNKGLFDSAVEINELIHGAEYARRAMVYIGYSSQAEGAGGKMDLSELMRNGRRMWDMTATGRYRAVKSNPEVDDISAVIPWREENGERGLRLLLVEDFPSQVELGQEPPQFMNKPPSIEAGPIITALEDLIDTEGQDEVIEVPNVGYRFAQTGERGVPVPPIVGFFHVHRTFEVPDNERVLHVKSDIKRFPAVPCGTDAEKAMFYDAMQRSTAAWRAGGRKAACTVFYMPGHGSLVFLHPSQKENGVIPYDSSEMTQQAMNDGRLIFHEGVYQDNSPYAVENYYTDDNQLLSKI